MTLRLPSRPLLALAGLALLAPIGASAAKPAPAPVAAPSNPAPVAANPSQPSQPSTPSQPSAPTSTRTYTRSYTPAATTAPSGPTAAQLAAARRAKAQASARKLAAQRHRHQMQVLAAAQTHAEAVLRTELALARRVDAVDSLAVSVADSIGAAPARELPRAAASPAGSSGGGSSIPVPAIALAACAGLLGIAAAFSARRGGGLATAAIALTALLLAGI